MISSPTEVRRQGHLRPGIGEWGSGESGEVVHARAQLVSRECDQVLPHPWAHRVRGRHGTGASCGTRHPGSRRDWVYRPSWNSRRPWGTGRFTHRGIRARVSCM